MIDTASNSFLVYEQKMPLVDCEISKILDEIHKIREKVYEEEKGLTREEVIRKSKKE